MLCLYNAWKIFRSFPDYTIFICKFTTDECFLFQLETFKNCKEVKHIMIMIIAIIYIFFYYAIFDEQLKITFRKTSGSPGKILFPFLLSPLTKIQKLQVPLFVNDKNFLGLSCRKVGERALCGTDGKSSSNPVKSKSINQSKICLKFQT